MRLQVRFSQWVSRALVVALMLTAAPLPTYAGGPPAPARPTLAAAIQHAAAVTPLAPARGKSSAAQTSQPGPSSTPFFKKPAGIAALAILAAGVGYALYSTQNDRITSPGRK